LRRFLIMVGFALEGRKYYLRSVFPRKEVLRQSHDCLFFVESISFSNKNCVKSASVMSAITEQYSRETSIYV